MSENPWEKRLTDFLKKAGDEIRRTGEEIKAEAQKLYEEVRDPQNQQRVKEAINNLGTWTEKAVKEVAERMEGAVKKAEGALNKTMGNEPGEAATGAASEGDEAEVSATTRAKAPRKAGKATGKAGKKAGKAGKKAGKAAKKAGKAAKKPARKAGGR